MYKLDEIVSGYLLQNLLPEGQYNRIYQIAIRGYRFLHQQAVGTPKTAKIKVGANCMNSLPCELLSKLKVYNIVDNKKVALVENTNITGGAGTTCGGENVYTIDWTNRTLTLNPGYRSQFVYIDYLPIAGTDDGDYLVLPTYQEPLTDWIKWKDSVGRPAAGNRQLNEKDFWNSLSVAKKSTNPFDPDELLRLYSIDSQSFLETDYYNGENGTY